MANDTDFDFVMETKKIISTRLHLEQVVSDLSLLKTYHKPVFVFWWRDDKYCLHFKHCLVP